MTWKLIQRELNNVMALPAKERYSYFVLRVADWEEVWSLKAGDGWVLAADEDGREAVPVWPHEAFASLCATGEWAGNTPVSIDLREWLEDWTPGMVEDNRLVAVFPNVETMGVTVEPDQLRHDLQIELDKIE